MKSEQRFLFLLLSLFVALTQPCASRCVNMIFFVLFRLLNRALLSFSFCIDFRLCSLFHLGFCLLCLFFMFISLRLNFRFDIRFDIRLCRFRGRHSANTSGTHYLLSSSLLLSNSMSFLLLMLMLLLTGLGCFHTY